MEINYIIKNIKGMKTKVFINDRNVNLNKGPARRVLNKTLGYLDKAGSNFVDCGFVSLERVPHKEQILITKPSIDTAENSRREFTISVKNDAKNGRLFGLEKAELVYPADGSSQDFLRKPLEGNLNIKEHLYEAFCLLNKFRKTFDKMFTF